MLDFIKYKTRGNALPHGKPRVFLVYHPDDFQTVTTQIIEDVLSRFDCAVYYIDDDIATIPTEELELALNEMNLVIAPISRKLLSSPCEAMTILLPNAIKMHIPILPILIEPGLDQEYASVLLNLKLV